MERRVIIYASVAISLVLALASCVSPRLEGPPQWISGVGGSHPDGVQFIAYGRGEDRSGARAAAADDGMRRIEQIIVDELESRPITIDDNVALHIEEIARRRMDHVEYLDDYRHVDSTDFHEVFLLLLYRTSQITEDVDTIVRRFTRTTEEGKRADGAPEREEEAMVRLRRLLDREVPADEGSRIEILRGAMSAASNLTVTALPAEETRPLAEGAEHVVTVAIEDLTSGDLFAPLAVAAEIIGPVVDGQRNRTTLTARTDGAGVAEVAVPPPQYAGTTVIEVAPAWFRNVHLRWEELVTEPEERELLEGVAGRLRDQAILRVTSRAAEIPTAVAFVDRDIAGNPITGISAMTGVLQELGDRGFRVRTVTLSAEDRDRLSADEELTVADLYDIFPFEVLSSVDRAIVGDARIISFDENEGYNIVVETRAVTFDLRRDHRFPQVTVTERISGSSAQATIRAAFQESGRRLARILAPQLP